MIKDVLITPMDIIKVQGGNVMHAMKSSSLGYVGFNEAYFSEVEEGAIKAWKRHKEMTLNIVVPRGIIRFVLYDDREIAKKQYQEIIISLENYCRITIPPMVWIGFQGLSNEKSLLLNMVNIEHDPNEIDRQNIENFKYDWRV